MQALRMLLCCLALSTILVACGESDSVDTSPAGNAISPTATSPAIIHPTEESVEVGGADGTATTVATFIPLPPNQAVAGGHGDWIVVGSLTELVEVSPIIFIGTVRGQGDVVNLARDVSDIHKPDSHLLHLGQVYEIDVERYLHSEGPVVQDLVQLEGMFYNESQVLPATITPELERAARDGFGEYVRLEEGARYLFFLKTVPEFEPVAHYVAGSHGVPWRFTLPEDGESQADSPVEEANRLFSPQSSESLVREVEELIGAKP